MPIVDFTNVTTVLLALVLFVLLLFLAKESSSSKIIGMVLFAFLIILVGHTIELGITENITEEFRYKLSRSLVVDFVFIFLSFISYLWIDEIETRIGLRRSIDNSLDWFWKKV